MNITQKSYLSQDRAARDYRDMEEVRKIKPRGKIVSIFCIAIAIVVGGCGGSDSGTTSNNVGMVNPPINSSAQDYSFVINCPYYFIKTNSPGWGNSYGGNANRLKVDITDRSGRVIQNIDSRMSNFGQPDYKQDVTKRILESNTGQYLNITCGYTQGSKTQSFTYRHPISDSLLWRKNARTSESDAYFEVSMLADMHRRIWELLMARGRPESSAWDEAKAAITASFGSVTYGAIRSENLHTNGAAAYFDQIALASEESENGKAFRRLKLTAELHTGEPSGDVQQIIAAATTDYIRTTIDGQSCTTPEICGAVFKGLTKVASSAPEAFANPAWQERRSTDPNYSSVSQDNVDGSWTAGLTWKNGTTNSEFVVQRHQTVQLNVGDDYKRIFLDIGLGSAVGGCVPSLFGCTSASGIAGTFVCFDDWSKNRLGCVLFGAISDAITISNLLGNSFTANDPLKDSSIRGVPISSSSPNSTAYGLDRVYALSDVMAMHGGASLAAASKSGNIGSVTFGAAVLASSSSCYQCKADLNVRRLGLRKL